MNKNKLVSPKVLGHSAKKLLEHFKPSTHNVGAPPGTLTYTGQDTVPTQIRLFQYNKNDVSIHRIDGIENLKQKISGKHTNWIDVVGFQDIDLISELGSSFKINQLTLEDILNISQLPKIEIQEDYMYITLKMFDVKPEKNILSFTHYSLIVKENMLITFSEKPNTIFSNLEKGLKNNFGEVRNSTIDHLSYRIIDTIVDYYYFTLEGFANILADLETELVENPSKEHIHSILTLKKQWLILGKAIFPFKEDIRRMLNLEPDFIQSAGKHYIGDLHDHLQSIGETMEILRETLNNLMDLYSSTVSNKMNEVMQTLTIVATIFIPLTFIAGVYGMNFRNLPELTWKYG